MVAQLFVVFTRNFRTVLNLDGRVYRVLAATLVHGLYLANQIIDAGNMALVSFVAVRLVTVSVCY